MELALLVQLVLAQLSLALPPSPPAAGTDAGAPNARAPQQQKWPSSSGGWLQEALVFGAGGDCAAQRRRWRESGDPGLLLPPAELRRLVGFKVPAAELWLGAAASSS